MMVGAAPHIREVGPHAHAWQETGRDSGGWRYSECLICGARTTNFPVAVEAEKRAWLCGGTWDATKADALAESDAAPAAPPPEPEADDEDAAMTVERRGPGRPRKVLS
jgi:hypothetical protein